MASGAFYLVLVCTLRFLKRPTHAPSLDCFTHARHTFLLSYRQGTSTGNTGLPKITSADAPRPRTRGLLIRTFSNSARWRCEPASLADVCFENSTLRGSAFSVRVYCAITCTSLTSYCVLLFIHPPIFSFSLTNKHGSYLNAILEQPPPPHSVPYARPRRTLRHRRRHLDMLT